MALPGPKGHVTLPPQLENIGNFIKAIQAYGMKPHDIFEANDLFENGNMTQVQTTLVALAGLVRARPPHRPAEWAMTGVLAVPWEVRLGAGPRPSVTAGAGERLLAPAASGRTTHAAVVGPCTSGSGLTHRVRPPGGSCLTQASRRSPFPR